MKKFKVGMYLRISRDDGKQNESESITNQKALIQSFIDEREDFELVSIKVDDGYSGSDFERPGFKELMEEVKQKKINCIIVKDFSRFGRNFVEVSKYIEEIFPFMEVRFISINDDYDSINGDNTNLIVPFKNLINDAYLRDISMKVRSQLEIKKKNGQFIGAFATYGYLKDPNDKNKLVVDEYAAKIVQEIFKLKLEGYSHIKIAEKLNKDGILSPQEYKKHIGLNFNNGFKSKSIGKWHHNAIIRILTNPVYIGVLEQGKTTTLNYKVKKKIQNDKEKWVISENSHKAIIDKNTFEMVQSLMRSDTRIATNKDKLFLLSGILYCADCGSTLIRKNYGKPDKRYIYYVCSGAIKKNGCTKHSIRDIVIEDAVLQAIKVHIKALLDIEKMIENLKELSYTENKIQKLDTNINDNKNSIIKLQERKFKVYEDFKDGLINKDEYIKFSGILEDKINILEKSTKTLKNKLKNLIDGNSEEQQFIKYFTQYKDIEKLDRKLVVSLIEKIYVYEDLRISIKFRFEEQYKQITQILSELENL
ncbi:recombinase family protein [[Clostridium] colinum]|uniref:recombinase family protein n=1 Tax=[Clostridium] colinum TaxID=36835 RepID=UPI002024478D|nr:recombinase family protein [[Clostridium] colinum]